MKKLQKGFTLIELLVVIAIIGILSSVVLASLSSARTRGNDAAIQADLANMRAQAELFMSTNGNYGTATAVPVGVVDACDDANSIFASTTGLRPALIGVVAKAGGASATVAGAGSKVACGMANNPQTTWAVIASTSAGSWCVDSAGASKVSTAIIGGLCN
jgi:prepilin-type N-terminal cleavage/methylation domain-containing protein